MKLRASKLLPQPLLSLTMVVIWMLAWNDVSVGTVLLGSLLAWAIPLFTHRLWPDYPRLRSLRTALAFTILVLWDIIVANFRVAVLILSPLGRLRPRFITLETELTHPLAVTILASVISLTPGTVSSLIGPGRRKVLIHALDCPDEAEMVAQIKRRYEAPLKEIFRC